MRIYIFNLYIIYYKRVRFSFDEVWRELIFLHFVLIDIEFREKKSICLRGLFSATNFFEV